jgi:hypothetical protein
MPSNLKLAELEPEAPLERLEEQEVIDDSVQMYLHEIGRVPLTADDENTPRRWKRDAMLRR